MRATSIILSGVLLSFVGISGLLIQYVFAYTSLTWTVMRAMVALALLIWFTWLCVRELNQPIGTGKGLIRYLYSLLLIVFLSSLINLTVEYALFHLIDPEYKYELEETHYTRLYEHRMQRGLPPPRTLSSDEIDEKYSLYGLFELDRAVYVINFIIVLLLFPVAVLFGRLQRPDTGPSVVAKR